MSIEEQAVLELLPDVDGADVLDLACGTGRYTRRLVERGAARVVGLDLTAAMLARARHGSERPGVVVLVRGDLGALPFASGSFRVIVCGLAIGHVSDLTAALAEMSRVLGPGGVAVYSDLHPAGAAAGWIRTFRAAGRTYSVRHVVHRLSDHRAAGEDIREPTIDIAHAFRGWKAALVLRLRKEGQA
jgi:malonyl-CoA O-methyltransferase